MFNILTRKKELSKKSMNDMVLEIHDTFYTEVDRLHKQASIVKEIEVKDKELIAKAKRLKDLGFVNTKEVIQANIELGKINAIKVENEKNKDLIDAINFFSMEYPLYKFITVESVNKICEKYNLIYGPIDKYLGDVPEKNLKQIEQFKIKEELHCWMEERQYNWVSSSNNNKNISYLDSNKAKEREREHRAYESSYRSNTTITFSKCPLEIAAPIKDFDTKDMEVVNHKLVQKIEIPDPVVLCPVIFKNVRYFLIITAWGLEASDEIVVNQNFN